MTNKDDQIPPGYRQATQLNYDRLSRWYDLLADSSERRAKSTGLQKLAIEEGARVLEIGSGTGQALLELARSVGSSGKVFGVDISSGMISRAQEKLKKAGVSARAALLQGDALHLPFQQGSVDAVFMSFTLELFDPVEVFKVLAECRRSLKNGGMLCVVSLAKPAQPSLPARLYEWAQRKFPSFIDCRLIDPPACLSQAGFRAREVDVVMMWGLPVQIVLAEKT